MKLPALLTSLPYALVRRSSAFSRVSWGFLLFLFGAACSVAAFAKDVPGAAIILFDGPQGAAYVQITGMTLNGKGNVRVCEGAPKFDRNAYDAFPRANFAGATSLQRAADGVLTLTVNGKPVCVVPESIKFANQPELTPAGAAEQALLQGVAVSSSLQDLSIPPFKAGVQVVFAAAPDLDLADYLRAQRARTVKDWQDFLVHHPSSARLADAKNALAGLHQQTAEAAFSRYQKSVAARKPDLASLVDARAEAQAANLVAPGYDPAVKLTDAISRELDSLMEADRARLQSFQKAVQEHGSGYSQLAAARTHVDSLLQVRSDYAPLLNLKRDVAAEEQKLETSVGHAESLSASGRYDDALASLGPYRAFSSEIPRIDAMVAATYKYHFENGQRLAGRQEWEQSVAELRKAMSIRPDSKDADAALKNAVSQLAAKRDQQEANLALLQSNEYAGKSQFVEAYNILADLPDAQRFLVRSQLSVLAPQYLLAATKRAQKLQEVHLPIKGRADEEGVREAYVLLDRASAISGDPAITLKRDFLSTKISTYYVDQANRYLEKPSGSGAGVGWLYLKEAQRYGITNASTLKDQMARYASLYQRRARLSVGIMLRDQTSRRDNPGFADQLADAIANGLDSSGVSIEVVRKPAEAADGLQPNFTIVGEILEHRVVKNANLETPQSKYRAGAHEVKNPAWLQANTGFQSAQQELADAQRTLSEAQAQHKKKEIVASASDAVQQAQKQVDDLRQKLDTTEQTHVEVIVEPYHYTRKTFDLNAAIDLSVRLNDRFGNAIGSPANMHKESHKTATVVQDVKPEDSEGVTNQGVEPDETQLLSDLEIEARNALIKVIRDKASELPAKVLQEARARAQRGDRDGAAEQYVIYLNATADTSSPEHDEAAKFLHDQFNLTTSVTAKL